MKSFLLALALLAAPLVLRAQAQPREPGAAAATRTIYLIRHGAYVETKDDAHAVLTPLGVTQARLVAARLRSLPFRFDAMVSSTMTRAVNTAAEIHAALPDVPWTKTDALRECLPPGDGVTIDPKAPDEGLPAAKTLDAVFADYFVPAKGRADHLLLVCHGNVIRYLVTKALGVDTHVWLHMSVANASITIIRIGPNGRCKVLAVGDAGHIPADEVTGYGTAQP